MTVSEAINCLILLEDRGYGDLELETTCPRTGISYGVKIAEGPDTDDRAIPVILE